MIEEIFSKVKNKWNKRSEIKENLKNEIKEYSFLIKPSLFIAMIFILGISAILRANFNYIDDLRRAGQGYVGWDNFSRFASKFLSAFLHADPYLTDISPLPQLLAAFIMGISGAIIIYVYKEDKKFTFWDIIAIIPLGLSPYFLECFSYKFDAPYMAISVWASVFPLLFRKKNSIIYSILVVLCTLLMCMTYQVSSGIFLMLVLLIALKEWNEKKDLGDIFDFLVFSIINYLIGLLIFKFFIMVPTDQYVSNEMLPIKELLPGAIQHLKKYFTIIIETDFKNQWLVMTGFIAISFVYVFVRDSKRKKYIALPVSIIILMAMGVLSFGMYLVLTKPLFEPRAMYGFGVFLALMGVAISTASKAYPSKIVVFCLSWVFFVFAFTYGNALEAQEKYTDFRVNLVIEDLNDLEIFATDEKKSVQIAGTISRSPVIENMPTDSLLLNRLVPVLFKEKWFWGRYYFFNYFKLKNVQENKGQDFTKLDLPIIKDTMYHTIRGKENKVLIELK